MDQIALSKQGKASRVLSTKAANEMLTPVPGDAGLGFFLSKRNPGEFGSLPLDPGDQNAVEALEELHASN